MGIARAKGKLRGKQPKLSLRRMHDIGSYSISDLAEVFSVSRSTIYRTLAKTTAAA